VIHSPGYGGQVHGGQICPGATGGDCPRDAFYGDSQQ
jgi:hypothetical protein